MRATARQRMRSREQWLTRRIHLTTKSPSAKMDRKGAKSKGGLMTVHRCAWGQVSIIPLTRERHRKAKCSPMFGRKLCAAAALVTTVSVDAQAQQSQLVPFSNWMTYVGQQSGYTVTTGDALQFASSGTGCTPYVSVLGSCFGNNPQTPYIIVQPPVGQAALPQWTQQPAFEGPAPYGANINNFYQLSMNEALVTVITLPPVGAYWSFQSYLIERAYQFYSTSSPPTPCPSAFSDSNGGHVSTPDCGYNVFGLFNNTINNAVVYNQFGQGFSDENFTTPVAIAVITTPNQALYNTLQKYFYNPVGRVPFGSQTQVFPESMPTSGLATLHVGLSGNSDVFGSIIRYNLPQSQSAGTTWTLSPQTYINVYRVLSSVAPTGYPTPILNPQSYNTDECNLVTINNQQTCSTQRFQNDLNELSGLLISYLASTSTDKYVSVQAMSNNFNGFGCVSNGRYCQGGNGRYCQGGTEDNDSYRTYGIGQLTSGSYAAVIGVLHSSSSGDPGTPTAPINNALYTSVSWADNAKNSAGIFENEGVGAAQQSNVTATGFASPVQLTGSARQILLDAGMYSSASAQLKQDLPNLYVAVLTRSSGVTCNSVFCSTSAKIR